MTHAKKEKAVLTCMNTALCNHSHFLSLSRQSSRRRRKIGKLVLDLCKLKLEWGELYPETWRGLDASKMPNHWIDRVRSTRRGCRDTVKWPMAIKLTSVTLSPVFGLLHLFVQSLNTLVSHSPLCIPYPSPPPKNSRIFLVLPDFSLLWVFSARSVMPIWPVQTCCHALFSVSYMCPYFISSARR